MVLTQRQPGQYLKEPENSSDFQPKSPLLLTPFVLADKIDPKLVWIPALQFAPSLPRRFFYLDVSSN
jgi:hypothetical protein